MCLHQLEIPMFLLELVPAEAVHEGKCLLHLIREQESSILGLACIGHPEFDLNDIFSIFGLYLLLRLLHPSPVVLLNHGLFLPLIGGELSLLVVVFLQHGVHVILLLLLI